MDINFNIGGEAGQGIDTIGDLLTRVFVNAGFYTFTTKDYHSRIRGGYNFTQIRASDSPVCAPVDDIDLIVALSKEAIVSQRPRLVDGGVIVFDETIGFDDVEECHFPAPLEKTAKEVGGNIRMANAAALGAVLSIIQFPIGLAEEALSSVFAKKGEKIVTGNVDVAKALYDYTSREFSGVCRQNLSTVEKGPSTEKLLITGNQAIAFGAMAANVKFVAAYPMSPSTSTFQEIVSHSFDLDIATLQTEDEIAGICMAIGASFAGVRSFITTSGGGLSLMTEGIGLAAMTETPLVVYDAQRPGPSTGLPTRTEQGDLFFILHASQGEFPRIMLAPKDPIEAFTSTTRAFNLAEKFQVPVFILGDQFLADSITNISGLDIDGVKIDRGKLADNVDADYKRHKLTEDGISPRAFPGEPGKHVATTGNSHTEQGHVSEDPGLRNDMVEKFMMKMPLILESMMPPVLTGKENADTTLLTWGTTWGAVDEAISILNSEGKSLSQLHFCDIYPFRTDLLVERFQESKLISIEQNATSQFAQLVRRETGFTVNDEINKYDGRPMTARWVIQQLEEVGI